MIDYVRRVMNPAWYHGHGKRGPFFEGWYFKVINATEDRRFAFIPGVFIHDDPERTHSFVQVLDGMTGQATYHRYQHFEAAPTGFDVRIGPNRFQIDRISLNIDDDQGRFKGELRFKDLTSWPVTLAMPGVMGWFGWLPNMECNHGVLSLQHSIEGTLTVNDETHDFTGGKGYTEKDWGESFPRGYIWMQSNHFDQPDVSFTGSLAVVPQFGRVFPGFTTGLWVNGQLYRFGTYNQSRTSALSVTDTTVEWTMFNKDFELHVSAHRANGAPLKGPEREDMLKRVEETMQSVMDVRLSALDGFRKQIIFEGQGRNAALEVVGDLTLLFPPKA